MKAQGIWKGYYFQFMTALANGDKQLAGEWRIDMWNKRREAYLERKLDAAQRHILQLEANLDEAYLQLHGKQHG